MSGIPLTNFTATLDVEDQERVEDEVVAVEEALADANLALIASGKLKGDARIAKLARVNNLLEMAQLAYDIFAMSLQENRKIRQFFAGRDDALNKQLSKCITAYQVATGVTPLPVAQLKFSSIFNPHVTTKQLLKRGIEIEDMDIHSLEAGLIMIEQSKVLAVETIAELARQEEKLLLITNDVSNVKANLKYGARQLRTIARRFASDKLIRFLCTLILLAILAVSLVAAFYRNRLRSVQQYAMVLNFPDMFNCRKLIDVS